MYSAGRFVFGVGSGWMREEGEILGVDFDRRWTQTMEAIRAMKELWAGETSEFHGDYYDFPPVYHYPKPVSRPRPPILLGSTAPRVFERIVADADGWIPIGATPAEIESARATLDGACVGRRPRPRRAADRSRRRGRRQADDRGTSRPPGPTPRYSGRERRPASGRSPSSNAPRTPYCSGQGGAMPARAMWRGAISFGMVVIPIRLFNATRSRTIPFSTLHSTWQHQAAPPPLVRAPQRVRREGRGGPRLRVRARPVPRDGRRRLQGLRSPPPTRSASRSSSASKRSTRSTTSAATGSSRRLSGGSRTGCSRRRWRRPTASPSRPCRSNRKSTCARSGRARTVS